MKKNIYNERRKKSIKKKDMKKIIRMMNFILQNKIKYKKVLKADYMIKIRMKI